MTIKRPSYLQNLIAVFFFRLVMISIDLSETAPKKRTGNLRQCPMSNSPSWIRGGGGAGGGGAPPLAFANTVWLNF